MTKQIDLKTAIKDKIEELTGYIDDYFDDNKINQMINTKMENIIELLLLQKIGYYKDPSTGWIRRVNATEYTSLISEKIDIEAKKAVEKILKSDSTVLKLRRRDIEDMQHNIKECFIEKVENELMDGLNEEVKTIKSAIRCQISSSIAEVIKEMEDKNVGNRE